MLRKRNEQHSLVAAMLCWSRHSHHSAAIHGAYRNIASAHTEEYQKYTKQVRASVVNAELCDTAVTGSRIECVHGLAHH